MSLHFHPLAFGLMLVVAAGTVAYTWWSSNRQHHSYGPHGRSQNMSSDFDNIPNSCERTERKERQRKKKDEICSICLESLSRDLKTLTCSHTFHSHCISIWFVSNSTCPVCRMRN